MRMSHQVAACMSGSSYRRDLCRTDPRTSFLAHVSCSGPIDAAQYDPIHKEAPLFADQSTEQEVLSTGIKVEAAYLFPLRKLRSAPRYVPYPLVAECVCCYL